eukprot:TRINITY_DN79895_c0_g1_i1.p1 TRINITY_DN79895_c0_g1~~TRINITY_DN79895_c0_g1_i1.p1  ORF type:complete len:240 (+),score=30.61 TRINITY_DN79895_c0_g1_i1:104-721(+)
MSAEAVTPNPIREKPGLKNPQTKWRTMTQERIYGQRLLDAIKSTKDAPQPSKLAPSRAIKEAADSALALTAKGQTRWSRAILSRRRLNRKLSIKAVAKIRRRSGTRFGNKSDPIRTQLQLQLQKQKRKEEEEGGEKVGERLRVLSRLVPGGKKLSTPTLLEEAADYVAALQLQVKAMRKLADLLSATSISSSSSSSSSTSNSNES